MTEPKTIAAIDLGSNSFHLVVANVEDDRIVIMDTIKESVRLRMGLTEDGGINAEATQRALACLERFEQRIRAIPKDNVRVVGTNTLRNAVNSYEFLEQISSTLGVEVDIIGGREEARLIYLGVTHELPDSELLNLVVDIGGGSTEFIIGKQREPLVMESRAMGCVSFTMRYFPNGKLSTKNFSKALIQVGRTMERYRLMFSRDKWSRAIGTSGTAKAIEAVLVAMNITREGITREGLEIVKEIMIKAKTVDNLDLPGLRKERLPVFPGGFAVMLGIFIELGIEEMSISHQSLREGVIYDFLGRGKPQDKRVETVEHMMDFYGVDRPQVQRVRQVALSLLPQVTPFILHRMDMARNAIGWAAQLHEIGKVIAHTGYHKHGAYVLLNGDMPGFSAVEQGLLSFLVANHRKSLKQTQLRFERNFDWPLLSILRLAVIFSRDRVDKPLPNILIDWPRPNRLTLKIPKTWLDDHPLTRYDLEVDRDYWRKIDVKMDIKET